jgi:hypothetical protein
MRMSSMPEKKRARRNLVATRPQEEMNVAVCRIDGPVQMFPN